MMESHDLIKYPLSTEKAVRLMESENTLSFVVDRKATKPQIKKSVEEMFKAKVIHVQTYNDSKGRKRAYVRFSDDTPALDIATNLGLM